MTLLNFDPLLHHVIYGRSLVINSRNWIAAQIFLLGLNFWKKRHESVTRGGGRRFLKPTKSDFDIFEFWVLHFPNEFSCISPGFSKPDLLYCSRKLFWILSWFSLWHYIHTCIPEMTLKFCNNFYLLQMRGEQRKSRRLYDPIQEGKQIICEKPQVYIYTKSYFNLYADQNARRNWDLRIWFGLYKPVTFHK